MQICKGVSDLKSLRSAAFNYCLGVVIKWFRISLTTIHLARPMISCLAISSHSSLQGFKHNNLLICLKSIVELFQIIDNVWNTLFITCPNHGHLGRSIYGTNLNPCIREGFSVEPDRVVLRSMFLRKGKRKEERKYVWIKTRFSFLLEMKLIFFS